MGSKKASFPSLCYVFVCFASSQNCVKNQLELNQLQNLAQLWQLGWRVRGRLNVVLGETGCGCVRSLIRLALRCVSKHYGAVSQECNVKTL